MSFFFFLLSLSNLFITNSIILKGNAVINGVSPPISIDIVVDTSSTAKITYSGPSSMYYAFGLYASSMIGSNALVMVVNQDGSYVEATTTNSRQAPIQTPSMCSIQQASVISVTRTVILSCSLTGWHSPGFPTTEGTYDYIWAAKTTTNQFCATTQCKHDVKASGSITFNKICDNPKKGGKLIQVDSSLQVGIEMDCIMNTVKYIMNGPQNAWFGIVFGTSMSSQSGNLAIVYTTDKDGNQSPANCSEYLLTSTMESGVNKDTSSLLTSNNITDTGSSIYVECTQPISDTNNVISLSNDLITFGWGIGSSQLLTQHTSHAALNAFITYSFGPTTQPTNVPSTSPSMEPTIIPTKNPLQANQTTEPTKIPTKVPTSIPTKIPTKVPTSAPTTNIPTLVTLMPSEMPTLNCLIPNFGVSLTQIHTLINLSIIVNCITNNVDFIFEGPSDKWFGIVFGDSMASQSGNLALVYSTGKSGSQTPANVREYIITIQDGSGITEKSGSNLMVNSKTDLGGNRVRIEFLIPLSSTNNIFSLDMINIKFGYAVGTSLAINAFHTTAYSNVGNFITWRLAPTDMPTSVPSVAPTMKCPQPKYGQPLTQVPGAPISVGIMIDCINEKIEFLLQGPIDKYFGIVFGDGMISTSPGNMAIVYSSGKTGLDTPNCKEYRLTNYNTNGVNEKSGSGLVNDNKTNIDSNTIYLQCSMLLTDTSNMFNLDTTQVKFGWALGNGIQLNSKHGSRSGYSQFITYTLQASKSPTKAPVKSQTGAPTSVTSGPSMAPTKLNDCVTDILGVQLSQVSSSPKLNVGILLNCLTNRVEFLFEGPTDKWIGIVFGTSMASSAGNFAIVYSNGKSGDTDQGTSKCRQYLIRAKVSSGVQQQTNANIMTDSDQVVNSLRKVKCSMPFSSTNGKFSLTTGDVQFSYAIGGDMSLANFHSAGYGRDFFTFNLQTGGSASKNLTWMIVLHGILMFLAWSVFGAFGIFASRNRYIFPPGPTWFKIHKICQITCVIAFMIGFIMILSSRIIRKVPITPTDLHEIVGLIIIIIGFLQPINAIFRGHPGKPDKPATTGRKIWELFHKSLGYIALFVAQIVVITGLKKFGSKLFIAQIVWFVILVGLFIYFGIRGCRQNEVKAVATANIDGDTPVGHGEQAKSTSFGDTQDDDDLRDL